MTSRESTPLLCVPERVPEVAEEGKSASSSSEEEEEEDEEEVAVVDYGLGAFSAIWRPVAATMTVASGLVVWVPNEGAPALEEDDERGALESGLENAGLVVVAIVCVTCCVLALFWLGCVRCLKAYMLVSCAILLGVMGGVVALSALARLGVETVDAVSFCAVAWNWSACGVLAIFAPTRFGLEPLTPLFLTAIAVVMAWQLAAYPPATTWCVLLALAAYDAFAVLAPCGPLRLLVNLMATRGPLPGLLYEADLPTPDRASRAAATSSVKLGLGDFVFYSVLVSRAAARNLPAAAACFVATLLGLALTLALLAAARRPLPALPASIFLGVSLFFATDRLIRPFLRTWPAHAYL